MRRTKWICLLLAILLSLAGCGAPSSTDPTKEAPVPVQTDPSGEPITDSSTPEAWPFGPRGNTEPEAMYEVPDFAGSAFHEDLADGNDRVKLDLSAVSDGYIAVAATSEKRLKFQVILPEITYTYDMASDGTPSIFPLQSGDAEYKFRVMENITENKYAELYSQTARVELADEFQPFLRPSNYVNYTQESECVKKGAEFSSKARTALDVIAATYKFVAGNIKYDKEKALTVKSGYLPDPDETLATGMGICFDYASLAAAILRSQGIPTKLIFGYVSPGDQYHAWNMFYTAQTGWVTVEFKVDEKTWNRMDLTFAAGGVGNEFIGDGENYTDLYMY